MPFGGCRCCQNYIEVANAKMFSLYLFRERERAQCNDRARTFLQQSVYNVYMCLCLRLRLVFSNNGLRLFIHSLHSLTFRSFVNFLSVNAYFNWCVFIVQRFPLYGHTFHSQCHHLSIVFAAIASLLCMKITIHFFG